MTQRRYLNRDNQPYVTTTLSYLRQPSGWTLVARVSGDVPDSTSRDPRTLSVDFFCAPADQTAFLMAPLGRHQWHISSSIGGIFEQFIGSEGEAVARAQEHAHNFALKEFRAMVREKLSTTTP